MLSAGSGSMIFLTYDFVWFALLSLVAYAMVPWPQVRLALLVASGLWFQAFYGGLASVLIVVVLATVAYAAGRTKSRTAIWVAIAACVGTLFYYKYLLFLATSLLAPFFPSQVAGAIGALA